MYIIHEKLVEKLQGNNDVVMMIIEHYLCAASMKKPTIYTDVFKTGRFTGSRPMVMGISFFKNT